MHLDLTLATEWEVVLLNAFSKAGNVTHEKDFSGSRYADIYFESFGDQNKNFVADITAISDKGLDEHNPFYYLWEDLVKNVKERGLRPDSFRLEVDEVTTNLYKGGPKAQLKLPGRARFAQVIFNEKFENFLREVSHDPNSIHTLDVKTTEIGVTITYNPNQMYGTGGHLDYTQVFSLEDNSIYKALESKVLQLEGTNFSGHLGIILCDGGCSFFNRKSVTGLSFSMDDVIKKFLYEHPSISFVITFGIEKQRPFVPMSNEDNPYQIIIGYYRGHKFDSLGLNLHDVLEKVGNELPEPESNARNALNLLKGRNPTEGRSHWGGLTMSPGKQTTEVKISARALLEFLAGKVDQKTFFERHGFIPSELTAGPPVNPFEGGLSRGQLIDEIQIEKSDTEDDDWITIRLKGPDPAVSPFVVPASEAKPSKK
jgi:hypothetical protein